MSAAGPTQERWYHAASTSSRGHRHRQAGASSWSISIRVDSSGMLSIG